MTEFRLVTIAMVAFLQTIKGNLEINAVIVVIIDSQHSATYYLTTITACHKPPVKSTITASKSSNTYINTG